MLLSGAFSVIASLSRMLVWIRVMHEASAAALKRITSPFTLSDDAASARASMTCMLLPPDVQHSSTFCRAEPQAQRRQVRKAPLHESSSQPTSSRRIASPHSTVETPRPTTSEHATSTRR
eukprot:1761083-Rhodomonas_salina.2